MKIKKEYGILFLVIVALSLYLMLRHSDRTHYELPEIAPVKTDQISKIEIVKSGGSIVIEKKDDDRWVISPDGYPAGTDRIEGMLDAIGELSLTALVSQSENYNRYELDEGHKIVVKAWAGSQLKREFEVGKAVSSFQHTFVKLPKDDRVYHATGNFRSRFDQTVDGLRDKGVLSFDVAEIKEILITRDKSVLRFARADEPEAASEERKDTETAKPEEPKTGWKTPDGQPGDETELKRLLTALSALRCEQFMNDLKKEDLKNPTHIFELKGVEEYSLSLFAKRESDGEKHPAISSASAYPFFLPEWQVNNLTKKLDQLVEETKTPADKKDKNKKEKQ
jgi:hypothetical protein